MGRNQRFKTLAGTVTLLLVVAAALGFATGGGRSGAPPRPAPAPGLEVVTTTSWPPFELAGPSRESASTTIPFPDGPATPTVATIPPATTPSTTLPIADVPQDDQRCLAGQAVARLSLVVSGDGDRSLEGLRGEALSSLSDAQVNLLYDQDPSWALIRTTVIAMIADVQAARTSAELTDAFLPISSPSDPAFLNAIQVVGRHLRDVCPQLGVLPEG